MWITSQEDRNIDYVFRIIEIPTIYYIVAVILAALIWVSFRKPALGLLTGYIFLIIVETLLIRHPFEGRHIQPELFWSWRDWSEQRQQIIGNIVMFIPIGVLSGMLWKWRGLLLAGTLSGGIEILQLITARGLCEIDDVIHNMAGAAVGIGIVLIVRECIRRVAVWRKNFESYR